MGVSKCLAANLERFVCHFGQYGSTCMSKMNSLCEHTIVIPRLPCLFIMANTVSLTVKHLDLLTSDYVKLFNFAMWALVSKCFASELVPCSDGWRRTWWQTIYMISGLPVSLIPQCKWNRHKGSGLELFQAIGRIESTYIEAHQALKKSCKVRSLKSWINTHTFLEDITTTSIEVFKDCESDMAVGIWKLGNTTQVTAESNVIVQ